MTARVARGNAGRSRSRGGGRSTSTRRAKQPGLLEEIGFAPGTGRRVANWIIAGMAAAVILAAVLAFRLPQLAVAGMGEGLGQAGFTLRRVDITGANRVSRTDIYNVAFDQPSMAMPMIDLEATRQRLLRFGWIREARVSRHWPDRLVVDVIERQPAAIWQHGGRLNIIDSEGVVLEPVRVEAMPQLPLIVGASANRNVAALAALIERAPRLRPLIAGATWVGERRWDLRFEGGELLMLPEGEEAAQRAIQRFAAMDQQDPLLGRGFVRIDMRDPRRTYVRISRDPGAIVPTLTPPDPGQPPADPAETI